MREHARKYIEWRLFRRITGNNSLQNIESFVRASTFHQNDLHSAAVEFEEELTRYASWIGEKGRNFRPKAQNMGFGNDVKSEWEEIALWWGKQSSLNAQAIRFFDEYVHDSRASFKLSGPDSETKQHVELGEWLRNRKLVLDHYAGKSGKPASVPISDRLNESQRRVTDEYGKTGKIPRMINSGRERWQRPVYAGYLRFRKIYGGSDEVLLSSISDNVQLIERTEGLDPNAGGMFA
jgi:hypothetical protein